MRSEAQVRALLLDLLYELLHGQHSPVESQYIVGRMDSLRWVLEVGEGGPV